MFYSWTDIEKFGYENPKDFVNKEMQRQDQQSSPQKVQK